MMVIDAKDCGLDWKFFDISGDSDSTEREENHLMMMIKKQ